MQVTKLALEFSCSGAREPCDYFYEYPFRSIWKNCYVQARVHGNFTEGEAIDVYSMVMNNLKCSGNGNSIISHELRYFEQPICIKMENMNKSDGNRYRHYELLPSDELEF